MFMFGFPREVEMDGRVAQTDEPRKMRSDRGQSSRGGVAQVGGAQRVASGALPRHGSAENR